MNPEITQLIERYLLNELSQAERQSFELQLAENDQLLQQVILHRQLHEAAKRASQRNAVQQTAKRYHFRKNVVNASIAVFVVATITAITVWATNRNNIQQQDNAEQALISQLEADKHTPLEHIVAEYFHLNQQDTVVFSKTGVLLSIPDGAFLLNGKPYSGPKMIQWQEAINAADIVKAGLSTFAGEHLLETQGMFALQAFAPDGTKLGVNPDVGVYVQVPVDELKEGMMLFEGKKMNNGMIDWQNPEQLTKLPQLADMKDLDFYPPDYEAKLNELKWKTGKKERDSLYLSFEDEPEDVVLSDNVIQTVIPFTSGLKEVVTKSDIRNELVINALQKDDDGNTLDTVFKSILFDAIAGGTSVDWKTKIDWNVSISKIDESHGYIVAKATLTDGWYVFSANHRTENAGGIGVPTAILIAQSDDFSLEGKIVDGENPVSKKDELGEFLCFTKKATFLQKFVAHTDQPFEIDFNINFQICDEKGCIFPSAPRYKLTAKGFKPIDRKQHIPPSAVIAFWQPKFNNTILATRDFEKRMKAIHATCDKKVLEVYTDNLNKPLYKIDEQVVKMGYPEFREFAAERVGGVELDNPHMNNLRQYYEGAVSKIRKELKKDQNFVRRQEIAWDNRMQRLRTEESGRTARRQSQNSTEEARFNYEAMVRQLGKKPQIGFTIFNNTPVFNCDRYTQAVYLQRMEWKGSRLRQLSNQLTKPQALPSMASMYLPPALKVPEYKSFSVSLKNNSDYGKTMVYLFPKQVKSFQRLDGSGGQFSGRLNKDMQYDLLVVGIAENGFYLYEETGVDGGQKTINSLEQVSEGEFNRRIEAINANRLDKPMAVFDELEWLVKEQQNYKVQRLRMEKAAFRNKIRPIVFPCLKDAIREETEPEIPEIQI